MPGATGVDVALPPVVLPSVGSSCAVVKVDERGGRPQLVAQFFSSSNRAWSLKQKQQKLGSLAAQSDSQSLLSQFTASSVQLEHAEANRGRS